MVRRGSRTGPLRDGVLPDERAQVAGLLGVTVADTDAALVLDPRGLAFQRLEWQGDSALDAVVALHRWSAPACCAGTTTADLVSDAALAARAVAVGLATVLDWVPDASRLADTVEACVGAAWHVGAAAAATTAGRLVHPGVVPREVAPRPEAVDLAVSLRCEGLAPAAHVGAAVLEAGAADHLLADPSRAGLDEGQLSRLRGRLLDGERTVRAAAGSGWLPGCGGHPAHLLDHVQARVGAVAVAEGLPAGLAEAGRLW